MDWIGAAWDALVFVWPALIAAAVVAALLIWSVAPQRHAARESDLAKCERAYQITREQCELAFDRGIWPPMDGR